MFSAADRKYDIYFHYPWSEYDEVRIELPEGYALESSDPPAAADFGAYGSYKSSIEATKDGRAIIYQRMANALFVARVAI